MLGTFPPTAADVFRQLRLLRRHLRYGLPGWTQVGQAARADALAAMFRSVNAHLRALGGDYWLVYGTLLGWHREGRILAHDDDVDFGAPIARFDAIWASRHRLPPGCILRDTSRRHHGPKLYFEYRGWEADLYFFTEKDGRLQSTERSRNPGDMVPFPREFFYPPQPAFFLGEPTFVPAQPQAYLEHIYRDLGADAVRDPVTRYYRPRHPRN